MNFVTSRAWGPYSVIHIHMLTINNAIGGVVKIFSLIVHIWCAASCVAESQDTGSSSTTSARMIAQDVNECVPFTILQDKALQASVSVNISSLILLVL